MQNPVWDETFHFDIHNGKEEIKISVMDRNMMKQDTVVGVRYIPIEILRDQQKIEDWYNLDDPHSGYGEANGRIRVQLWWIHSKTKLIEDRIIQTEEDIDKILGDKKYYQEKVGELREPFGWNELNYITKPSPERPSDTRFAFQSDEVETDDEGTKNNLLGQIMPKIGSTERSLAKGFESLSDNLSFSVGVRGTPWFRIMQYFNVVYFILTLMALFLRGDFVNLTV